MRTSRTRSGSACTRGSLLIESDFQADAFFVGRGPQHGDGLLNQFAQGNAAWFDAHLAAFGASGFEQVANHGVQLVHALQNGFQMIGLVGRHRAGKAIEKQSDVLMNAGQRSAQFVRNVREKLVLEFQLLLLRDFEGAQQTPAVLRRSGWLAPDACWRYCL